MGPRAQVVLLAGPSGAGKSRLAQRCGLPVLHLDDFYLDGGDPSLPRDAVRGIVDWDDPRSWDEAAALSALVRLCGTGQAEVPVYDIAADRAVRSRVLHLDGSPVFVAEGIFAAEVVGPARAFGLVADALCLRHHRVVTFARRLTRDLRERRKPARVLVRRGLALLRSEQALVARHVELGCRVVTPREAARVVAELRRVRAGRA